MDGSHAAAFESDPYVMLDASCTSTGGMMATPDATGYAVAEFKVHNSTVYQGGAWWVMVFVAFALLTLCALLAGLTLAICGLEMAWLHMKSVSGTEKEKQQALVISRLKRHSTWMLCSLILCSVACSEYFPFIVQGLCHANDEWVAVLISTLLLAVFAELIPQWLIPRNAIEWGYYCWPLIWGCMWLTVTVSYPLSWFLDSLTTKKDGFGIFTNEELAAIIRFHEKSERRGGMLDADTSRILLGALAMGDRKIGRVPGMPIPGSVQSDTDIEKGNTVIKNGIIINWSAVKCIGLDDVVDGAFCQNIMSWSYSRIPVVSEYRLKQGHDDKLNSGWEEEKKVFGYIHIRNLLGIITKLQAKPGLSHALLVRDLTIYPLLIVGEDISVIQMLGIFQQGMSRMALVTPMESTLSLNPSCSLARANIWTSAAKEDGQIIFQPNSIAAYTNQSPENLSDAQVGLERQNMSRQSTVGTRVLKTIGIVTFHDIVDAIFQKTSHDEEHIFSWDSDAFHSEPKNESRQRPVLSIRPAAVLNSCTPRNMSQRSYRRCLRIRKESEAGKVGGVDGADERSLDNMDEIFCGAASRCSPEDSSYTQNSQGGFHGYRCSNSFDDGKLLESKDISSLGIVSSFDCPDFSYSSAGTTSLPSHQNGQNPSRKRQRPMSPWRHFSDAGKLPYMLFASTYTQLEHPEKPDEQQEIDGIFLPITMNSTGSNPNHGHSNTGDHTRIERDGTNRALSSGVQPRCCNSNFATAPNSWYLKNGSSYASHGARNSQGRSLGGAQDSQIDSNCDESATDIDKLCNGFPPELSDKITPTGTRTYESLTMPRKLASSNSEVLSKEEEFHNDRALLPSQRQVLHEHANYRVTRIASLWF